MTTNTPRTPEHYIPGGTRVLNINDGEPGHIMNGYAWIPATGEWTEYQVETRDAIEVWKRSDFILFSEFENEV